MKRLSFVAMATIAHCGCANTPSQAFGQDASMPYDASSPVEDSSSAPPADSGRSDFDAGTPDQSDTGSKTDPVCPAASANADSIPFAIDVGAKFVPSGYEGDATGHAITMSGSEAAPACSGERSSPTALGVCHTVVYTPLAPGAPIGYPPGATSQGWAAVVWQHPANNWGTEPGYLIPPGATKVSFWVKGAKGGEGIKFFVGGTGFGATPTASAPCADPLSASSALVRLTTTWTQITIPLQGAAYTAGVLTGFGFAVATADQGDGGASVPADGGAAGAPTTFYVDDIEWQQ
jgi:hypothetical protein